MINPGWIIIAYFIIGVAFWFASEVNAKKKLRKKEISEFSYNLWKIDRLVGNILFWPGTIMLICFRQMAKGIDALVDKTLDELEKKEKK